MKSGREGPAELRFFNLQFDSLHCKLSLLPYLHSIASSSTLRPSKFPLSLNLVLNAFLFLMWHHKVIYFPDVENFPGFFLERSDFLSFFFMCVVFVCRQNDRNGTMWRCEKNNFPFWICQIVCNQWQVKKQNAYIFVMKIWIIIHQ